MKYNEQNVIGLQINTNKTDNLYHKYSVVEGALIRQASNEKISYNHISTANMLNSGAWIVVKSKIHKLW